MEEATTFFQNKLKESKESSEYLTFRGLNEKSIEDFRIGFAPLDWRTLYDHLKSKNFSDTEIERAGLAKKPARPEGGTEKGMYDRFRGRIMFPLSDSSGRVIAFSGRILVDDGKSAKYLNSPDTPIFKKSSILYGLDKAKQSIRKNDFSIVVEGQFDLILSHQAGFKNTVATSGTALASGDKVDNNSQNSDSVNSVNNLGLISRLSQNIVFVFDADKAGFAASIRATPIAMALFSDMNVKATQIPEGMDPADLISQKGPEAWREVIRNSKHIIEFLLDKILAGTGNDVLKIKLEINNKVIPFIALINNPVKTSHFISLVADKSGISENDIRDRLKKIEQESKNEKKEMQEIQESGSVMYKKDYIERKLLGIVLWQMSLVKQGKTTDIEGEVVLKKIAEILKITPEDLLKKTTGNEGDFIFEAEVFYGGEADVKKDVEEMLANLEEEHIKEELGRQMRELHNAEEKKDRELSAKILKECQILNSRMQDIKNGRLKK